MLTIWLGHLGSSIKSSSAYTLLGHYTTSITTTHGGVCHTAKGVEPGHWRGSQSTLFIYKEEPQAYREKAMATHSSTLAWKIPWTEEPGRLQSMESKSRTWLSDFTFTFMPWRRKWQLTPVFLPGESQGRGNLVGCRLWGRTDSDTTEAT